MKLRRFKFVRLLKIGNLIIQNKLFSWDAFKILKLFLISFVAVFGLWAFKNCARTDNVTLTDYRHVDEKNKTTYRQGCFLESSSKVQV